MELYNNVDITGYIANSSSVTLPYKGGEIGPNEISEILDGPLIFGNQDQIHALKAWTAIDAFIRTGRIGK